MSDATIWYGVWILLFIVFILAWRKVKKEAREGCRKEAMSREAEKDVDHESIDLTDKI